MKFGWHNDKPIDANSRITIVRFGSGKDLFFRATKDSSNIVSHLIKNGDLWTGSYELNGKYNTIIFNIILYR